MKMSKDYSLLLFLTTAPLLLHAQILSTPDGTVGSNETSDYVIVNGQTKLVNPNGRAALIERDDEDSWITFHDPDGNWYSMGIDYSNNGLFTLNYGGSLGL